MQSPRTIVILGGGFGGAYCAQALERRVRAVDARTLLIDRDNYFIFYPLLIEAGTGTLQPRHAVVSIRSFLRTTEFRMAEVIDGDPVRQEIRVRLVGSDDVRTVHYDQLVVALGSVTRLPAVPGLREHGYELKSLPDAIALRDRAIQMLELADAIGDGPRRRALLHFVIVGANYTGVEAAGEFQVFLREASRRYPNVRAGECQVTLVELGERILPALDPELSDFAALRLGQRGVKIHLKSTLSAVHADHVVLRKPAGPTGEDAVEEVLPTCTTIWCAGIEPSPVVRQLGLPLDDKGYVQCEPDLRVKGFNNIWAIGDCARNLDPDGHPYPATAQHALRMGRHLAENLVRDLQGEPTQPFVYRTQGMLAALGCRTGVAKVFGIKISGFAAWFLWRTVYLFKMPGLARKIRIALDWTADLIFPRDYVQFGVPRGRRSE